MQIQCTNCGAKVAEEDVNQVKVMAKCRACRAIFDFSDQFGPAKASQPQRRRVTAPMPQQITVHEDPPPPGFATYRDAPPGERGKLVIVRRWYTPILFAMVLFCIFWNGFLINWYRTATSGPPGWSFLAMVFPLLHVTAGVVIVYTTIAGFVNRTTITVTEQELSIVHAPLPWPGNRRLPARELKQLYTEEEIRQGKNGSTTLYHLSAVLEGGKKQRLLSSLQSPEQALFIEQKVEERLGIVDVAVAGEYKG